MTDDLVKHLREVGNKNGLMYADYDATIEAADEIERLRAALKLAQNLDDPLVREIERLRAFAEAVVRYAGNAGDDYLADKARDALKEKTND